MSGKIHPDQKLTEDDVRGIKNSRGIRIARLAEFYKVSRTTILYIKRGEKWKHIN